MMLAVHRRVAPGLCGVLMMIAVNGTLVAAATRAGNSHQSRTRNRRINQQNRKQADPCRHALGKIKSGYGRMFHHLAVEHFNHTPKAGRA